MQQISWTEYRRRYRFKAPVYPRASNEYIWTYPVDYGPLDPSTVWKLADEPAQLKAYALYVHFPFCEEICPFCTFCHTKWDEGTASKYVDAVAREIEFYSAHPLFRRVTISSVYFGGGTPCLLSAGQLSRLLHVISDSYPLSTAAEVSLECNPLDVSREYLQTVTSLGVNRVSFGVQTLDPQVARVLGIRHRDENTLALVKAAGEAGFRKVAVDLIYGVRCQSPESLIGDIDKLRDSGATSVSLYWLDVTSSKLEAKEKETILDEEEAKTMYYAGRARLLETGFLQQAQPDFARGEIFRFLDNAWRAPQGGTVGFGAGATTFYFNGWTYVNLNGIAQYVRALEDGVVPILGGAEVPLAQLREKYAVLGFRCVRLSASAYRQVFGTDLTEQFGRTLDYWLRLGVIERVEGDFHLTEKGLWYVDNVCRSFYGAENEGCIQPWSPLLRKVTPPGAKRMRDLSCHSK